MLRARPSTPQRMLVGRELVEVSIRLEQFCGVESDSGRKHDLNVVDIPHLFPLAVAGRSARTLVSSASAPVHTLRSPVRRAVRPWLCLDQPAANWSSMGDLVSLVPLVLQPISGAIERLLDGEDRGDARMALRSAASARSTGRLNVSSRHSRTSTSRMKPAEVLGPDSSQRVSRRVTLLWQNPQIAGNRRKPSQHADLSRDTLTIDNPPGYCRTA
jgi:hypothetical protein